jgi:SAM-dependent methyltransferase
MDVKGTLKAITLELRRELEGKYDAQGTWQPGDLERRLAAIGVRWDRAPIPADELPHLAPEDREARRVSDAFLQSRAEAGQSREAAIAEFVRDAAYTWANRLLALRCMESRALIDEVILQKEAYGGRSLQHNRLAKKHPERCAGEDEGLFAVLFDEFARRAEELPLLFDPQAPKVALRPSVATLKHCIALLSGTKVAKGQEAATDEVFAAPDALGWTYQYWNTEEKNRVFEKVRTKKGSKIEGAEIIPATCIYTEPYMVKFLVQNSLGARWMGMYPDSRLAEKWEYYIRGADRAPISKKAIADITFLDPACGSGHFLIEAFEFFYAMYVEEGALTDPAQICASILERNLYGIDIDERAVQIAALALVMKAKEKAPDFVPRRVNLVATNIRVPATKEHLDAFLRQHPEDDQLRPALIAIFGSLAHAEELGSLLQLEEPVEKELRALKSKYEAAGFPAEQKALWPEFHKPVQGKLPIGVASYEEWKESALARIREHLDADAQSSDLGAAFFGEAGGKGVSLVDVLSRRYDVVATNPPYMGSKNMGPMVKRHVERHFGPGKRDLYAAFILRCRELARLDGKVAMVTQQSWMFLNSYTALRAPSQDASAKALSHGYGVLRETRLEVLAHLGRYAFSEIGNAAVAPVLFVLGCHPSAGHHVWACRLNAPREAHHQASLLSQATRDRNSPLVHRPAQDQFLKAPGSPICYWLSARFFELLNGRTLTDIAVVTRQVITSDNARFVRAHWEVPRTARWSPYVKGGGFRKWIGFEEWALDWSDGLRLRAKILEKYPYLEGNWAWLIKLETMGQPGWTFSRMAEAGFGVRRIEGAERCDNSSPVIIQVADEVGLGAILNCRSTTYLLRSLSTSLTPNESYVSRVPVPRQIPKSLGMYESLCCTLKADLVASIPTERRFKPRATSGATLREAFIHESSVAETVGSFLHLVEGLSEKAVLDGYQLDDADRAAICDETGTPAGWYPLLKGYDPIPQPPAMPDLSPDVESEFARLSRLHNAEDQLSLLRAQVVEFYENGGASLASNATTEIDTEISAGDGEDEDEAAEVVGGQRSIPAETLIEALSHKIKLHPISVYWMLEELRKEDGVLCKPELVRFVEDYASVMVLRLLGHRWPQQVETAEPIPEWADRDGVILILESTSEPTLLARVRRRLAADFGETHGLTVEREFEEITGRPLASWLGSDFFKRHISQFRKRPIAWQISSTPAGGDHRRRRGAGRNTPAFSCLVYYQRLDADLLPKLRTQYVGPLRTNLQTELGGLEKLRERSADQDARRLELEEKVEELQAFDARLEQVIAEGFASPALDKFGAKEPLDKWASRDGRARAPETREALLAQERRYDPDLNDGVRVNIAPLQRAGVLASDVLAMKDVEKAIADRAEWRADERRWCREAKLPQPGWWPSRGKVSNGRTEPSSAQSRAASA